MNSLRRFFIDTLTGGILFLLPLTVMFIILKKVYEIMKQILAPIAKHLPDDLFGLDGHQLISILILIMICFLAGLLFRSRLLNNIISKLEDGFLSMLPGYTFIKSMATEALDHNDGKKLCPALVQQGDGWQFVLIIEERDGFSTVFLPETPDPTCGNIFIFPNTALQKLDVSTSDVAKSLKRLGKGSLDLFQKR